ncbi:cytochrome C biogenesis protein [Candidatus Woesearchaeota archaeon]|nr:cytochrome C biogenesis protein [Candidatus Woesearchaeota archaeon]
MVSAITNYWLSFLGGLLAPLGAVCVLPLYPGFLAYLAGQIESGDSKYKILKLGLIVSLGVISSMFLIGLVFSAILRSSLTNVIGVISPIAFGLLAIISVLLIFNVDIGRFFPKIHAPITKNPYRSSFVFGFFFGAIVLPCNPASLALLFAVSTSTISFLNNLLNFLFFGIGMALPLLVLAALSSTKSGVVISFLTLHKKRINLVAGLLMLGVSLYYLIFVFKIFGGI